MTGTENKSVIIQRKTFVTRKNISESLSCSMLDAFIWKITKLEGFKTWKNPTQSSPFWKVCPFNHTNSVIFLIYSEAICLAPTRQISSKFDMFTILGVLNEIVDVIWVSPPLRTMLFMELNFISETVQSVYRRKRVVQDSGSLLLVRTAEDFT